MPWRLRAWLPIERLRHRISRRIASVVPGETGAIAAAQEIINKARQANEAELAKMKSDLRREIGTLAVKAAMQVTGKVLTADDQQRLADDTNKQLAA